MVEGSRPASGWATAWRLVRDNPFWFRIWLGAALMTPAAAIGGFSGVGQLSGWGRLASLALGIGGVAATIGVGVWTWRLVHGFPSSGRHGRPRKGTERL